MGAAAPAPAGPGAPSCTRGPLECAPGARSPGLLSLGDTGQSPSTKQTLKGLHCSQGQRHTHRHTQTPTLPGPSASCRPGAHVLLWAHQLNSTGLSINSNHSPPRSEEEGGPGGQGGQGSKTSEYTWDRAARPEKPQDKGMVLPPPLPAPPPVGVDGVESQMHLGIAGLAWQSTACAMDSWLAKTPCLGCRRRRTSSSA